MTLLKIPENAAQLDSVERECQYTISFAAFVVYILSDIESMLCLGANDISKFFMLIIPIVSQIVGGVSTYDNWFEMFSRSLNLLTGFIQVWIWKRPSRTDEIRRCAAAT